MNWAPWDNALFLANFRERLRVPTVVSHITLIVMIWGLAALVCYNAEIQEQTNWLQSMLHVTFTLQAVLLFLLATRSVATMTLRERDSGTLNVHRISPTPVFTQCWGLIVGPAILEWALCLALAVPAVALWVYLGYSLLALMQFYLCLTLNALVVHAITVAAMLRIPQSQAWRSQSSIPILFLFLLYLGTSIPSTYLRGSLAAHLTAWPAYIELVAGAMGQTALFDRAPVDAGGLHLKLLALQVLVQGGHLLVAYIAAMRMLKRPGQPLLSQFQSLLYIAYVYMLLLWPVGGDTILPAEQAAFSRVLVSNSAILLGLLLVSVITANAPRRVKAIRRAAKLGRPIGWFADGAANLPWLAAFGTLSAAAILASGGADPVRDSTRPLLAVLSVTYVVWFGAALEAFRLSRHRRKLALFVTTLAVPYLFLPLFGMSLASQADMEWAVYATIFSPFYAVIFSSADMWESAPTGFEFGLAANVLLAFLLHFLALQARRKVDATA